MPPRSYASPLRAESARRTRLTILEAARELFLSAGYVQTTIEQIADRAGVSRPTVFTSVGNKATVLKDLRDVTLAGDDEPVPIMQRDWFQEAFAETKPARSIELHARNVTRIYKRYAALDEVVRQAAATTEELAGFWNTTERQRKMGATAFVDSLRRKTPLRDGLTRRTAVEVLWVVGAVDPYLRFVRDCGWSPDAYQAWLAQTWCDELLPTAARPRVRLWP